MTAIIINLANTDSLLILVIISSIVVHGTFL